MCCDDISSDSHFFLKNIYFDNIFSTGNTNLTAVL